jgi:hypothetical protein
MTSITDELFTNLFQKFAEFGDALQYYQMAMKFLRGFKKVLSEKVDHQKLLQFTQALF